VKEEGEDAAGGAEQEEEDEIEGYSFGRLK
jgi:hypothetical protein